MNGMEANSKGIAVCVISVVAVVYILFSWYNTAPQKADDVAAANVKIAHVDIPITWEQFSGENPKMHEPPADIANSVNEGGTIAEKKVDIKMDGKTVQLNYAEVGSPTAVNSLLLLHGMAFTSQNWIDLGTMALAARMGWRVIAVDLPGFGKSTASGTAHNRADVIKSIIDVLKLGKPVIVSPSMSGSFALPFLLDGGHCDQKALGYIPIAPVGVDKYQPDVYAACPIKVLIVYGTQDSGGASGAKTLQSFKNHATFPVEGAGHPAYLNRPEDWHRILFNYLAILAKEK